MTTVPETNRLERCRLDTAATHQMLKDIMCGEKLETISASMDIPLWKLHLRIANFALQCLRVGTIMGQNEKRDEVTREKSQAVVLEALAKALAGERLVEALEEAQKDMQEGLQALAVSDE